MADATRATEAKINMAKEPARVVSLSPSRYEEVGPPISFWDCNNKSLSLSSRPPTYLA